WGAPTSAAEITSHSASYPISERSPSTTSSPRPRSAATFSTKTYRGRKSLIILWNSFQRPLRLPVIPSPLPATLMSWQGNPPATTSTRERVELLPLLTSVTLLSARGKFLASTLRQYGSISTCHLVSNPARSNPRSMPPIPAKRLPMVGLIQVVRVLEETHVSLFLQRQYSSTLKHTVHKPNNDRTPKLFRPRPLLLSASEVQVLLLHGVLRKVRNQHLTQGRFSDKSLRQTRR